ncbi:hypothetical protein H4I96_05748 [Botrytis cinerea]
MKKDLEMRGLGMYGREREEEGEVRGLEGVKIAGRKAELVTVKLCSDDAEMPVRGAKIDSISQTEEPGSPAF